MHKNFRHYKFSDKAKFRTQKYLNKRLSESFSRRKFLLLMYLEKLEYQQKGVFVQKW